MKLNYIPTMIQKTPRREALGTQIGSGYKGNANWYVARKNITGLPFYIPLLHFYLTLTCFHALISITITNGLLYNSTIPRSVHMAQHYTLFFLLHITSFPFLHCTVCTARLVFISHPISSVKVYLDHGKNLLHKTKYRMILLTSVSLTTGLRSG